MRKHPSLLIAAAVFLGAGPVVAAPSPAASPLGGPRVPGVCLLSQQAVLANAKVGVAATARLREIAVKVQADLAAERQPIEADARALQAQAAGLKPADLEARRQALAGRVKTLEEAANQKSRQIELTREKALSRIAMEAQPVIAEVYKAHGCGLLLDRNSVLGGNMGGDLTAAVVQGLDAKMSTISFELESLPMPAKTASR